MTDMLNDPDLEARVRRAMHSLADTHQPSPGGGRPRSQPSNDSQRRAWLMAAATLLVLAGVAAVFAVANRDTSTSPMVTEPPVMAPSEPSATPNAHGDATYDPADLRFSEPLADGVAVFVNDTSLPAPNVPGSRDVPLLGNETDSTGPPTNSVRIVAMDGPRLLMLGAIVDVVSDTEPDLARGPDVEIGVDGATYLDEDQGGIVIPIDGGRRIVAPDEYFQFGAGGPFIDPDALIEIATAIGQLPLDQVDQLPGFFVFEFVADGEATDPSGIADATRIEHGERFGSPSVTLYRLAKPRQRSNFGRSLTCCSAVRSTIQRPKTPLFSDGQYYLELVSPVDLVALNAPDDLEALVASIDFAPLADLAEAFNGSVAAPPRPAPSNTDGAE